MLATLKPGAAEVIEVLHPEYETPVSRWRVRCGQCGNQGELIGAWSPPPMYRCLQCEEFNWRITEPTEKPKGGPMIDLEHTFGLRSADNPTGECLQCGDGQRGVDCCHREWSRQRRRFVARHIEEFTAAYENPDPAYSSHMLEMLNEESTNLSRGHVCNEPGGCPVENKARMIPPCPTCRARWEALARQVCANCLKYPRQFRPKQCPDCLALGSQDSAAAEIGRTSPITAPAPLTIMVDYFSGNMSA